VSLAYLTYKDSHENHEHNKKMWIIEDVKKCMELAQQRIELDEEFNIKGLPQEKIDKVCQNLDLQRKKNDRYQVLRNDDTVTEEETIFKTSGGDILSEKRITRENFEEYIEPIAKDEGLIEVETAGLIELLVPVLRQKRGGIKWRGIYHGRDVKHEHIDVIMDRESINFYMQDDDFKDGVTDKDIKFASGDTMAVKIRVTFMLSDTMLKRKTIYVERVVRFNKDVIKHKNRTIRKNDIVLKGQSSFPGLL
jgi:hypothetical protein